MYFEGNLDSANKLKKYDVIMTPDDVMVSITLYTEISEANSVSSATPKWKIEPNMENTVDGKEDIS